MKKTALSLIYLLLLSFVLTALQGNLYFLPLSVPYFWFIIYTYYSFKKPLLVSLTANLLHVFILSAFTSLSIGLLLVVLNLITFFFSTVSERFHTQSGHIAFASAAGSFLFLFIVWISQCFFYPFYYPNLLSWIGTSIATLIVAPPIVYILGMIDQKVHYERIDTLQNLRI